MFTKTSTNGVYIWALVSSYVNNNEPLILFVIGVDVGVGVGVGVAGVPWAGAADNVTPLLEQYPVKAV